MLYTKATGTAITACKAVATAYVLYGSAYGVDSSAVVYCIGLSGYAKLTWFDGRMPVWSGVCNK